MGSNKYFNNFNYAPTQLLVESLIIESLGIYGIGSYYIPRQINDFDPLYGEDRISTYNKAYLIDTYVKDIQGFTGQGDFLSRFNIQIRDSMTFTIARKTFNYLIGGPQGLIRPNEGDLIWFPLNKKLFIVKFVEHESIFYQAGTLQTYDLQCDLWEYSNEQFNTGLPFIDIFQEEFSFAMTDNDFKTQDGLFLQAQDGFPLVLNGFNYNKQVGEVLEDNDDINTESSSVVEFTTNPFTQ